MKKQRLYKEEAAQADLFHFELGNELGAHIQKEINEKKRIAEERNKVNQNEVDEKKR